MLKNDQLVDKMNIFVQTIEEQIQVMGFTDIDAFFFLIHEQQNGLNDQINAEMDSLSMILPPTT